MSYVSLPEMHTGDSTPYPLGWKGDKPLPLPFLDDITDVID